MNNDTHTTNRTAEQVELWLTVQKWRKIAHRVVTGVLVAAVCSLAAIIRGHDIAVTKHSMAIIALEAEQAKTFMMFSEIRADIKRILERLPNATAKTAQEDYANK